MQETPQLASLSLPDLSELHRVLRTKVRRGTATGEEVLLFKAAEAEIIARAEALLADRQPMNPAPLL
jgi:hypothetical protein